MLGGAEAALLDCDLDPILAKQLGRVAFRGLKEGLTCAKRLDASVGRECLVVTEHELDSPTLVLDEVAYPLPWHARVLVSEGDEVVPGARLTIVPRDRGDAVDVRGGVPGLVDLFEGWPPQASATLAPIDGTVDLEEAEGRWTIQVRDEGDSVSRAPVPDRIVLRVWTGQRVRIGDRLTRGAKNLRDVLRLEGAGTLQRRWIGDLLRRLVLH